MEKAKKTDADEYRPPYQFSRPSRLPFRKFLNLPIKAIKNTSYLLCHVFTPYEPVPSPSTRPLDLEHPSGLIEPGHLELCEHAYEVAEYRRGILEQKSSGVLTLVAILTPLIISCATFIAASRVKFTNVPILSVILLILAMLSILVSLLAIFRTTRVGPMQTLYFNAIIDADKGEAKQYDIRNHSLGLLNSASYNQALNDHLADFLRASQTFSLISVVLLVLAAGPVLYKWLGDSQHLDKTQIVKLDEESLKEMLVPIEKSKSAVQALHNDILRIAEAEERIQLIIEDLKSGDDTRTEIIAIREALRKIETNTQQISKLNDQIAKLLKQVDRIEKRISR